VRRTFITLARADGARAALLEMITHAPRDAYEAATRYEELPVSPEIGGQCSGGAGSRTRERQSAFSAVT